MRAVMVQVPEGLLEERRRTGADRWDEYWEGVLHMGPPPSGPHQRLGTELLVVLAPLAASRGLVPSYETGFYRPGVTDDYRVPDHVYARPEQLTDRGVEGPAPLVVEIRSPGDETYDKLDWYSRMGVAEVLVVTPESRAVELFTRRGVGMVLVQPGPDGVHVDALDVWLVTVEGPRLRLTWDSGSAEI